MSLRLLDLFCGAGGCSVGYHRAGFEVVGVDIKPQPHYPFEFFQKDWYEALLTLGPLFDVIHASPPCQHYTVARHIHDSGQAHPDLVGSVRTALTHWAGAHGKPWIIENVPGSPLHHPVMLCGLMFGLKVLRHRHFESNLCLLSPPHPKHPNGNLTNSNQEYSGKGTRFVCVAGNNFVRKAGAEAMGIDWMPKRQELAQAIPPAFTEYIGRQLCAAMRKESK